VLLLPNTDVVGAVVTPSDSGPQCRRTLFRRMGEPITASFGVAARPEDVHDVETLLDNADRAVHRQVARPTGPSHPVPRPSPSPLASSALATRPMAGAESESTVASARRDQRP
jgi:hypothetical protein